MNTGKQWAYDARTIDGGNHGNIYIIGIERTHAPTEWGAVIYPSHVSYDPKSLRQLAADAIKAAEEIEKAQVVCLGVHDRGVFGPCDVA